MVISFRGTRDIFDLHRYRERFCGDFGEQPINGDQERKCRIIKAPRENVASLPETIS